MNDTIKEAVLALAETDPELAAALAKEATAKVRQSAPAGSEAHKFIAQLERAINTKNMFTIVFTDRGLMPGAIDIWYAAVPPGTTGVDYMNAKVRLILTVYGFDSEGNLKGDKIRVEPTISRGIKARKKTARPELVLKHTIKMIQAAIAAEATAEATETEVTATFDKGAVKDFAKTIAQGAKGLAMSKNYEQTLAQMANILEDMADFVEESDLSQKQKLSRILYKATEETGKTSMWIKGLE